MCIPHLLAVLLLYSSLTLHCSSKTSCIFLLLVSAIVIWGCISPSTNINITTLYQSACINYAVVINNSKSLVVYKKKESVFFIHAVFFSISLRFFLHNFYVNTQAEKVVCPGTLTFLLWKAKQHGRDYSFFCSEL